MTFLLDPQFWLANPALPVLALAVVIGCSFLGARAFLRWQLELNGYIDRSDTSIATWLTLVPPLWIPFLCLLFVVVIFIFLDEGLPFIHKWWLRKL